MRLAALAGGSSDDSGAQASTMMSFPNHLADPKPLRWTFPTAGATLALLFVLCGIPRAIMAYRVESVTGDGAFYIRKAQRLESGVDQCASDAYDLNVYPILLAAFHRAGLDWETAAKIWGVLAGSLTVLPLYGWARRVFDERVALLAGILYAVHPKLIEWSPELMRDPTFWLLFALALYCAWRAVTEVLPAWFAAAGVATFLAIHTRFEGWFLLWPLLLWSLWRLIALRQARARLCGGLTAFTLCYPLVIGLLIYCHGYQHWEWGSFHRLQLIVRGLQSKRPTVDPRAVAERVTPPSASPERASRVGPRRDTASLLDPPETAPLESVPLIAQSAHVTRIVADKIGGAFSPAFGLLALVGLVRWWRLWLRRDHLPLILLSVTTVVAVWFHATVAHQSSTRYLLPLVVLAMPLSALGLLPICRVAARLAAWISPGRPIAPFVAASAALLLVMVTGPVDALTSRGTSNAAKAELGRWLRDKEFGQRLIVGSLSWGVVAHYAQAEFHVLRAVGDITPAVLEEVLLHKTPEYVVLSRPEQGDWDIAAIIGVAAARGLELVPDDELPRLCRGKVTVLRKGSR
jgi:4-amino-4-deoxy-L-arabinose transferase-like glycosyltransferase